MMNDNNYKTIIDRLSAWQAKRSALISDFSYKIDMEFIAPYHLPNGKRVIFPYPPEKKYTVVDAPFSDMFCDDFSSFSRDLSQRLKTLSEQFVDDLTNGSISKSISNIKNSNKSGILFGNLIKSINYSELNEIFAKYHKDWISSNTLTLPFAIDINMPIVFEGANIFNNNIAKRIVKDYILRVSLSKPSASFFLADFNDVGVFFSELTLAARSRSSLISEQIFTDASEFNELVNALYAELALRLTNESKRDEPKYIIISSLPHVNIQTETWRRFCDLLRQVTGNLNYGFIPIILFDNAYSQQYNNYRTQSICDNIKNATSLFYSSLSHRVLRISALVEGKFSIINSPFNWLDTFQPVFDDDLASKFRSESIKLNKAVETDFYPEEYFKESSGTGMSLPIGRADNSCFVELAFDANNAFAIVAGMNRSGKSTVILNIIFQAVSRYSPDEVQLYLIDCKDGNQFGLFAEIDCLLPNIKKIMLCDDLEYGISIVKEISKESKARNRLFQNANCTNYVEYRAKGYNLPRLLVVADEFEHIFGNQSQTKSFATDLNTLFKQCAYAGINIILCSQDSEKMFPSEMSNIIHQITRRIQMKTQNKSDLQKSLGITDATFVTTLDKEVRKLSAGRGLYTESPGSLELSDYVYFNAPKTYPDILRPKIHELKTKANEADFVSKPRIMLPKDGKSIFKAEFDEHWNYSKLSNGGLLLGLGATEDGLLHISPQRGANQNLIVLGYENNTDYYFRQSLFISMIHSLTKSGFQSVIIALNEEDTTGRVVRTAQSLGKTVLSEGELIKTKLDQLAKLCDAQSQDVPIYVLIPYYQDILIQSDTMPQLMKILKSGSSKHIHVCIGSEEGFTPFVSAKTNFFHKVYLSKPTSPDTDYTTHAPSDLSEFHAVFITNNNSTPPRFKPFIWNEPTTINSMLRRFLK